MKRADPAIHREASPINRQPHREERIETIMSRKNTTDPHQKQHMAIANAIRLAKKRLFENHRSGMPLDKAMNRFMAELDTKIQTLPRAEEVNVPSFVTKAAADLKPEHDETKWTDRVIAR